MRMFFPLLPWPQMILNLTLKNLIEILVAKINFVGLLLKVWTIFSLEEPSYLIAVRRYIVLLLSEQ